MRKILALLILLLVGCSPRPVTVGTTPTPGAVTPTDGVTPAIELALREVTEEGERPPRPEVSPLDEEAASQLLASLAPLPRPKPSPRARPAGKPPVLPLHAPPPLPEPSPEETRVYPEGAVKFADRLAVSYGKPTAPLGAPPPTDWGIVPRVAGTWRWLGTKTLLFEPKDGRFPMATEFSVKGPELKWKFSTPPPALESSSPEGEGQELTPTIQLVFNQRVTPGEVLKFLSLRAGDRSFPLRLLDAAERAALEPEEVPGTRVLARPEQPLPSGTNFKLYLKEGLPSAEGPLKKPGTTFFEFRTYDALKLSLHHASTREWYFEANNVLDEKQPVEVKVEPPLEGQEVEVSGPSLVVRGESKAGTHYQVNFSGLKDVHGQGYGGVPMDVVPSPPGPKLQFTSRGSLEPDGPGLEFVSFGYAGVIVERYRLTDEEVGTVLRTGLFTASRKPDSTEYLKLNPAEETRRRLKLPRGQWWVQLRVADIVRRESPFVRSLPVRWPRGQWVQVTDMNALVWRDAGRSHVWVTRLADSRPVEGARVNGLSTNAQGLAVVPDRPGPIRVQAGTDVCFAVSPPDQASDSFRWFVADDRSLYRPGETAHVHGWLRRIGQDLELVRGDVTWELKDANYKTVRKGKTRLHGQGSFQLELKLPSGMESGDATLELRHGDQVHHHSLQIEEFRRSDFETTLSADPRPVVVGSAARAEVVAQTFSGGSLAGATVNWDVTAAPMDGFSPPGWSEYGFGGGEGPEWRRKLRGACDQQGVDKVELAVKKLPPVPYEASITSEVQDLSRQHEARNTSMTLLPADVCLGLRGPASWLATGEECTVQAIVTDPEGKPVTGRPVTVRWLLGEKQVSQDKVTSGDSAVALHYTPTVSGELVLEAETQDEKGRSFRTRRGWWVGRGSSGGRAEGLDVQLDRADYAPGTKATLQVRSHLEGAVGMVAVRHAGKILETLPLTFTKGRATLELPITEAHVPGLRLDVAVRGRKDNDAALETSTVNVPVLFVTRKLEVKVTPGKTVLPPGGKTTVNVTVTDAEGKPVTAELWAVAVDESVLAAAGSQGPRDPLEAFYAPWDKRRYSGLETIGIGYSGGGDNVLRMLGAAGARRTPFFDNNGVTPGGIAGSGRPLVNGSGLTMRGVLGARVRVSDGIGEVKGRVASKANRRSKPHLRKNFSPLALAKRVVTDAQGRATLPLKLPDNVTRYKIVVVAAAGTNQFGRGDSTVTAALPLNLRLAAPRFIRKGDHFELSAVVANQGVENATVRVAVRGTDLAPTGCQLDLKPDERAEVAFPVNATSSTAFFQAVAVSRLGGANDQSQVTLPVEAAATRVDVATYGKLDKPEGLELDLPPNAVLTLDLSGTPLGQLQGAVREMQENGFETGTHAAAVVLAGVSWPQAVPREAVLANLARLKALQDEYSGAFREWSDSDETDPILTLFAAQALQAAKKAGYKVDLKKLTTYIVNDISAPSLWSEQERQTFQAYRLEVLRHLGRPDPKAARKLAGQKGLPLVATGYLLPTLPALKQRVQKAIREEAGTATFTTGQSYERGHWLLTSDQETDAVLLGALLQVDPKNRSIPALARGLASPRPRSDMALALAVADLARLDNPPLRKTDVWSAEQHLLAPPGSSRIPTSDAVVLGASKLYYRLGMSYVSPSPLPPADQGFALERRYEAVDDNRDVTEADGTTTIKAGALVRVRITLVAPVERFRVALVDPLPAGLEVVNPALQGTVRRADETDGNDWWFNHHNLRDARIEAFADTLPAGVYTYSYLARATTAGTFQVPPATCHELSAPEISGRTGSTTLEIK